MKLIKLIRDADNVSDTTVSQNDDKILDFEPEEPHSETDFNQVNSTKLKCHLSDNDNEAGDENHSFKFPIPKNILRMSKSSSYYRRNDERLESETESELVSSNNSKIFNKSINQDTTRIKPKTDVLDPQFVLRPYDRLIRLGETVKYFCKVNGTKPLEVFWYKLNGDELSNDEKYEIYHDDENYYLKIFNTVQRDSGMYLCVISNDLEQNIDSFSLELRGI